MPADRLLGTLLRSLQTYTDQQDTPRLLGTASSLVAALTNPLNVTLLTSQLLSAPAIWARSDGLQTCIRCLSVFRSAAQTIISHEIALKDTSSKQVPDQHQIERTLPKDDWIRAVINGADEHSPRWRHLLALGGLLLGFGPLENEQLSRSMRHIVERALMTATNTVLEELPQDDEIGQDALTFVVNHCFPLVSDYERTCLNYDLLLPTLMRSTFHSSEGLRSAYFLGAIDVDVQPVSNSQFKWPEHSASYQQLQSMLSSSLLSSLGPLSRLIGHSLQQVKQPWLVNATVNDLEDFSRTLHAQWRQNKLSEIDPSEESTFLDRQSVEKTTPALWKLLRSALYGIVIILRNALGRLLGDGTLARDEFAPKLATQALHTLRHLYFVTTRVGSATYSEYTFVNLTALDVLAAYPMQAEAFLRSVRPVEFGQVPKHPLDRCLDLFFLNTAEHCTLTVSPQTSEDLLVGAAAPYLAEGGNNNLLPIFEAAHSVMLAVFSASTNIDLTSRHLPFYVDTLFKVFPRNLSARQFRLAFKTLMRITAPPSALSTSQPTLPATLLELLHERARHASTTPLFPHSSNATADTPEAVKELSEQAILALTLLDALTQLPLELLEEWLPLSTHLINSIQDVAMRACCQEYFWQVLIDGEMDPDRSSTCHAWWSTAGGREMVLFGQEAAPAPYNLDANGAPVSNRNGAGSRL